MIPDGHANKRYTDTRDPRRRVRQNWEMASLDPSVCMAGCWEEGVHLYNAKRPPRREQGRRKACESSVR